VTIIACIYILVGVIGFAYHFTDLHTQNAFQYDGLLIEFVRILAVIAGAFMLRAHNWARWLALAWIALHVVLSAFNSLPQFAVHCVFFAVIAWLLFRPEVGRYFRGARAEPV
jgi:hypothetical protein